MQWVIKFLFVSQSIPLSIWINILNTEIQGDKPPTGASLRFIHLNIARRSTKISKKATKVKLNFICKAEFIFTEVILPASAVYSLRDAFAEGPMIFCVSNFHSGVSTNVGVLEFTAQEG